MAGDGGRDNPPCKASLPQPCFITPAPGREPASAGAGGNSHCPSVSDRCTKTQDPGSRMECFQVKHSGYMSPRLGPHALVAIRTNNLPPRFIKNFLCLTLGSECSLHLIQCSRLSVRHHSSLENAEAQRGYTICSSSQRQRR